MEIEVERGILDEGRVTEAEGDLDHPHAERRHQGDPVAHPGPDLTEAEPAGYRGGIEHHGPEDVQVGGRRLECEEGSVEPGESFHAADYRPVDPKPPRPRSLSGSWSTRMNLAVSTRWMTSWAIRSPRWTS